MTQRVVHTSLILTVVAFVTLSGNRLAERRCGCIKVYARE
jgi:hypothetical protein